MLFCSVLFCSVPFSSVLFRSVSVLYINWLWLGCHLRPLMRRSTREKDRVNYKPFLQRSNSSRTKKSSQKVDSRISEIVDKFEETLDMDEKQLKNLLKKLDLEIIRFFQEYSPEEDDIDDLKEAIRELKDLIRRFESAHIDLNSAIGPDVYVQEGYDGTEKVKDMMEWISRTRKCIAKRRKAADDAVLQDKAAEEKKAYHVKVTLADHIHEEIKSRCNQLEAFVGVQLEDLTNEEVMERKKNVALVKAELKAVLDDVTALVKETPIEYDQATGVVEAGKTKRDYVKLLVEKYIETLDGLVRSRNLLEGKSRGESFQIELAKFSGYNSKLDIYTFQTQFEKLIAPQIVRNLQPEYLKNNFLDGQALLLVKEVDDLNEIWKKLKNSFGCTMILLQRKFDQIKKHGDLWKIDDKEKRLSLLTKLVNGMVEVETLAQKHLIEDQLYHHSYISIILDMIGRSKREKFAYQNAGKKMTCKEKWTKLRKFLEVDVCVLDDLIMEEKSQRDHTRKKRDQNERDHKDNGNGNGGRSSANHAGKLAAVPCVLCGKDDHVISISRGGKTHVHYIACEQWLLKTPGERLKELNEKGLCPQCLYPGAKKNHNGPCVDQYACKHPSHQRYNKSKHVMVCEDHKDEDANKKLFEKYKTRFITNSKVPYKDFTINCQLSFFAQAYATGIVQKKEDEAAVFMLQTVLVTSKKDDKTMTLNILWDNGCRESVSRKCAVEQLEVMNRAENIKKGPLILVGAGNARSVSEHGVYTLTLSTHDGEDVDVSGICMDTVTGDIPTYPLCDVEISIHEEYKKIGKDPADLPRLPKSVGGPTDILMGVQYLRYFPKEKYELPCGLRIYESCFVNADGSRGVVAGNHKVFTELEKQFGGTHLTLQAYCSQLLKTYHDGFRVDLDTPLLGTGRPKSDVDPTAFEDKIRENGSLATAFYPDSPGHLASFADAQSGPVEEYRHLHEFIQCENAGTTVNNTHTCCCHAGGHAFVGGGAPRRLLNRFNESENAGTDVSYRCVKCRDCPDCKKNEQVEEISILEEVQQNVINRSVTVDLENCETRAYLPFMKDPVNRLSPNEHIAMKVYRQQTRELSKKPKELQDTIESEGKLHQLGFVGWFDDLTEEEKTIIMNSPLLHFFPWRVVWNLNSVSTSCRLVFDASMKTNREYSINDLLAKGRNNMNKLVQIAIRWSMRQFAFHTDVQKMYNTVKLDPKHWCYQLYLWDETLDPQKNPRWKVIKTIIYGAISSGNQAERGLRQTAELQKEEFPRENEVVQEEIYVDDCCSGEETEIQREGTIKNLSKVLLKGGFKLKGFTRSGEDPPAHLTEDGVTVKVAGMIWHSKEDLLSLNIGELNFGNKKRGKKPTGTRGIIPESFTKRDCVGKVGEVFDMLGKITPISAGWKLDLVELTKRKLDWDDEVPSDLKETWLQNFEDMKSLNNVRFRRAIVPPDALNLDIETIDFGDASTLLTCAAVYARFKLKDGGFSCQLVFSKSKVVPEDMSMPRSELTAAELNAKIGFIVQRSFGKYFKDCLKLTDGQICLNWIHNDKKRLKRFVRSRVIEINRLAPREKWFYVGTKDMIADLGTRKGVKISDVAADSLWMNGHAWMKLEQACFPIKSIEDIKLTPEQRKDHDQECLDPDENHVLYGFGQCLYAVSTAYTTNVVPVEEVKKRYEFSNYIIDPNKFRLRKVVRVMALVLKFVRQLMQKLKDNKKRALLCRNPTTIKIPTAFAFVNDKYLVTQGKSGSSPLQCKQGMVVEITDEDMRFSMDYFYQKSTQEVKHFVDKKVYQKISKEVNGVLYYTGRILPSQIFGGKLSLSDVILDLSSTTFCVPLAESCSPFAYSLVGETHWFNEDAMHTGVETVLRYSQKIAYLIGGRELVKKYRKNCARCRILAKKAVEVAMGPVHPDNLNVAPAFYVSQVDIFGPVSTYSNSNKRATVKLWFVVFCCCSTTAIVVKAMEDYSADAFILSFMRFACRVGYPKKLLPDAGSQLLKGCKEMQLEFYDLKHRLHKEFGVEFETSPIGAHYVHGRVERKIRHVQESFLKASDKQRLSVLQWETLADQVANSINNQPIAVGNIVEEVENLDILTPNRLLLGRNNERSPTGDLKTTSDASKIIKANGDIFRLWFESWLISYVPTLIRQPKWFKSDQDTKVGDVILFLKSDKSFERQYQYGLVKNVVIGRDGKVREIEVEYQNHNEAVKRRTIRGVRDIVVVHPADEIGIELELGAIAKSCGH